MSFSIPSRAQTNRALALAFLSAVAISISTRADQVIYADSLQNGWANFSFAANNFANTTPVHSGSNSISVTANPYEAGAFGHNPLNTSPYTAVSFWVHGGTNGGQLLQVYANITTNYTALPGVNLAALPAGTWQQITLPLASLGIERVPSLTQLNIKNNAAGPAVTFYIDDVRLISDTTPPVVQNISPAPATTVSNLTSVTVTFSEPVLGGGASDLRVNGGPAETMTGSGASYTFTFSRPAEGTVNLTWDAAHGITDYGSPANVFDETAPGASWQYTYADTIPPVITKLFPAGGATIAALAQIEVTFSETVLGVEAADLLINGQPATNLSKLPGQPYIFQFPPPATGLVSVAWAPATGIRDTAAGSNAFAGGAWNYTLNPSLPTPDLVINEILCDNLTATGLTDADGEPQGWIEIFNRGTQPANLANWSLSDDPEIPGLWSFPARTLNPGEFLLVFASGKDRKPVAGELHTNFKLAGGGESLGLYTADSPRKLVSGFTPFPEQRNDISYGRDLYGDLRYFAAPTPGTANGFSTIVGVVEPIHVNVRRGHFTTPFALTASCPTPGATLRYTTNGAEPTTASTPLPDALQISNTTLFRVAAFKTNYLPSKTSTHTYFFNLPEGFRTLPALSIVTATNHLYGPSGILGINGGYYNSNNAYAWTSNAPGDYNNLVKRGLAWERPASVEWIRPADPSGFQVDCGLRLHGSDSTRPGLTPTSKFSFGLFFRGDYGPGRLDYPLFDRTTVREFDNVILRAGTGDNYNPFIRDEIHRRLSQDMGQIAIAGTLATVFVNGVPNSAAPWYNPCERVDRRFFQSHLGGSADWDVVGPNWNNSGVVEGDRVDFDNLVSYVTTEAVTNPAVYTNIARRMDLINFADYCILNSFAAMGDWPGNNWNAGKDRNTNTTSPWRFVVWDAENGMGNAGRPITFNSFTNSGTEYLNGGLASTSYDVPKLYQSLRGSPEFRLLWADRIQKHFFNGGALSGANLTNRFNELRDQLLALMTAWYVTMDTTILTWAQDRQAIYFGQMQPFGLTAHTNAPGFNQFGGPVAPGFALVITNTGGTIYYTTNGSDPRTAFTGAVSPAAQIYTGPVSLNTTVTVRARAVTGGNWSAVTEATFAVGRLGVPLRFAEIMYNPPGGSLYEFIELQNISGVTADLSGYYFSGINYIFPQGISLAGGARLVLGSNTDTNAWMLRYPGVTAAGWFGGSLNNSGERLALFDPLGNLITSLDYKNNAGWPTAADAGGRSLEIINPLGDPDDPANWQASASTDGTPGIANAAAAAPLVYLNELMAENISAVNHGGTFPDWIELRNPGSSNVTLTGWSLTDDGNARKFVFPATTISAGGHLIVWCDATTNTTPGLHTGFSLGKNGETVSLYDAATNRVDALTYGLQLTNYSVGRISGNWTLTTPTTNAANVAAALASSTNLALNEWLANPTPGLPDWIELFNKSAGAPVALQGLYLATSNGTHQITSLSFLAPLGYVQLFADEGVGPDRLDFKLSAAGETLTLADNAGVTIQTVAFGTQAEGVSGGRFPNGSATLTNFVGSVSPATANYLATWSGPVINEILARNKSITVGTQVVDYVELFNPNGSNYNLGGLSLSVNSAQAGEFPFPAGTTIPANGYLLIKCAGAALAATNSGAFDTGESLNGDSGGVYLFNTNRQVVSFVEYGPQVDDLPIGLSGGQWRLLSAATPGATNAAAAVLGDFTALRLNEWMPNPVSGDDWFELFNRTNRPVDLATISLSDDPALAGRDKFRPAALSFIGGNGFVQWLADSNAGNGRNHVNFTLDGAGESLLIYGVTSGTNFTLADALGYGAQSNGVSSGRLLDGATNLHAFPGTASPGFSNYRLLTSIRINEALAHTDPPLEDAIELYNPTASPVSITGWYLSDSKDNLRKYQITNTAPIPAGGYAVIYEYQLTHNLTNAFTLNSAYDNEIWLTAVTNGGATGDRDTVAFGASFNGVSFGRITTSQGVDFWPLTARRFGADSPNTLAQFRAGTGLSNAVPIIGPVVINEIMYHPPGGLAATEEFIELRNTTTNAVALYDPSNPTNRWKVGGGINFAFPTNVILAASAHLIVVDFNPADAPALAAFRARYNVSNSVPVYGPFSGTLGNDVEAVELYRPDAVQLPPHPDAGFVPYVIADRVSYTDAAPWPSGAVDGGGLSLQRLAVDLYGNEPLHWIAATPTPGANLVLDTDGDGIPDAAELALGLNPNDPLDAALDPDGDGATNLQEYLAGTDRLNANSYLKIDGIVISGSVTLSFQAVAGRTYSVLYKTSLPSPTWLKLTDIPAPVTNQTVNVNDPQAPTSSRFYRLVTPALP